MTSTTTASGAVDVEPPELVGVSNTLQGVTEPDFRAAQRTLWGEAGAWAYDTWHKLNAEHFAGELVYAGVVFGLTPHGHRLGQCYPDGRITLHSSLLDVAPRRGGGQRPRGRARPPATCSCTR
jgi:hypothetical protein